MRVQVADGHWWSREDRDCSQATPRHSAMPYVNGILICYTTGAVLMGNNPARAPSGAGIVVDFRTPYRLGATRHEGPDRGFRPALVASQ